jgi:hypothetical protein
MTSHGLVAELSKGEEERSVSLGLQRSSLPLELCRLAGAGFSENYGAGKFAEVGPSQLVARRAEQQRKLPLAVAWRQFDEAPLEVNRAHVPHST